jgi:replicative DNA helicase
MSETLASLGKHFQETLVRGLLTDPQWASQMEEVFKPEYFDLKYLQFLSDRYFQYSKKYRVFPSMQLLLTIIKDELKLKVGTDEVLCNQIVEYLRRVQGNNDVSDLPFVKEKSLEWCRKQALKAAFEKAIDDMQANKYERIADDIRKATMVGTTPTLGHDFFTDIEARFTPQIRQPIATGLKELDRKDIMNGGLGRGELGCVVACTGVGKSHFLVMLAAEALKQKKHVVYYSTELSETLVGNRFDSYLCEIDCSDLVENKEKVIEKYSEIQSTLGTLTIKQYPMYGATVGTIRAHIERMTLTRAKPDMIIVDYADKLRSSREYDQLRMELALVYDELRALAVELQVPVWTASQSNKEGSSAEIVDVSNMSEAYAKASGCDAVIGISRMAHEKAMGVGRLYVAKNRAGRDGVVYPIGIDTAQSRFTIRGEQQLPEDAKAEDDDFKRRILQKKWAEIQKDESLTVSERVDRPM